MIEQVSFLDQGFWHATSDGVVLWNAKNHNGWINSVSYAIELLPDVADASTPYAALHQDIEKEEVWERIRTEEFGDLPSRMKALFLFTRHKDVDRALATWWKNQKPTVFQLLVPKSSKIHIADSKHLNSLRQDWDRDARRYWAGEVTEDPHLEAVLHGCAWIPNIDQYKVSL